MDDDTGEYPVPVLVPREELEKLAKLILDNADVLNYALDPDCSVAALRLATDAVDKLVTAARRVLPTMPAVDSVDRE